MLTVDVPQIEFFDETKQEFLTIKPMQLTMEHSLIAISKWESVWCTPFLGDDEKTTEQTLDYIRDMTMTKNIPDIVFTNLPSSVIDQITEYITSSRTATWFSDEKKGGSSRGPKMTSELIYYYMIAFGIPFECQKWHLNRLLTLIKICNVKNQPEKKMTKSELIARNRALNASRRAKLHTKG